MKVVEHGVGSMLGEEELEAIRRVVTSGDSLSWADELGAFEEEFRTYCGAEHAISATSCTATLQLCAQVLRLGPDDEVVSTPQSFRATTLALLARGVHVRFADIDPETLNIDPASIEPQITPRTKAIYIVHHGGNPADMDAIAEVASSHGIAIVEDCAHASGSQYRGRTIGDGDLCCFSFQSLKNMTTLGEGGMLTTNNEQWAEEARQLGRMGVVGKTEARAEASFGPYPKPDFDLLDHATISWTTQYASLEEVGTHMRMSSAQAAVGRVQLRKLDDLNALRAQIAQRYTDAISQIPGLRPVRVDDRDTTAWHLYTCFVEPDSGVDRNALIKYVQQTHGVQIILRFWPLHLSAEHLASSQGFRECPVCERVWFEQQLNLPACPSMENWEVEAVIEALADGMVACRV